MKTNSKMHKRVIKIANNIIHKNQKIKKILIAGISYAENVDDVRSSKSLDMIKDIYKKDKQLTIYDPVVKISKYKKINIIKNSKRLNNYDLIIFNVKHKQFEKIKFNMMNSNIYIIDTNNVLNEKQIKEIMQNKIKLKIIGRGDI